MAQIPKGGSVGTFPLSALFRLPSASDRMPSSESPNTRNAAAKCVKEKDQGLDLAHVRAPDPA